MRVSGTVSPMVAGAQPRSLPHLGLVPQLEKADTAQARRQTREARMLTELREGTGKGPGQTVPVATWKACRRHRGTEACAPDAAGDPSQIPAARRTLCGETSPLEAKGLSGLFPVCLPCHQGSRLVVNSSVLSHNRALELRLLLKVSGKRFKIKIKPLDKGSFAEVIEI